jgi:tetratricopeptide (TPR) repeat protein
MSLSKQRVAAVVLIVLAVAVAAGLAWAAGPRAGGRQFLTGVAVLLLGAAFGSIRLAGIGGPTPEARRLWRGGWIGIVLGLALIGLDFGDGWYERQTLRNNVNVALNRGQEAAKAGEWAAAAAAGSDALRLDPDNVAALRRRAAAYLHLGENEKALADLDAALRLAPDDPATTYNRGLARARLNDNAGALADFTEAIRLNPKLARAYQARSRIHARLGNNAEADADWQRAVELDPALQRADLRPV